MMLTNQERETIIRRSADNRYWDIYSAIPRDIRRIRKMVSAFDGTIIECSDHGDIRASVPVRAITFRGGSISQNAEESLFAGNDEADEYHG